MAGGGASSGHGSTPSGSQSDRGRIEYYSVPVEFYRNEDPLDADIYIYYQGQYIIYKSKGSLWTKNDEQKLTEFGVSNLYLKFESRKDHLRYLDDRLTKILDKPTVPIQEKAKILYQIADPVLSTIYSTPDSAENISSAADYVKNCIKFLNEKDALPELVELSSKTLTEHVHALHVATYSIALTKLLGHTSYDEVFAMGMGALLHDIGKSKIDERILNKPGELDDEEWLRVRQHSTFGEEILEVRQTVPVLAKRIVAEHHERVNGKGYPRGVKSIHVFSRIVGVADCFNALTSQRPYNKAMSPFDALKFMLTFMKTEFDENILKAFIQMLSK